MSSELAGGHGMIQIALGDASIVLSLKMVLDSEKHSLAGSCLQRNGSATVAVSVHLKYINIIFFCSLADKPLK